MDVRSSTRTESMRPIQWPVVVVGFVLIGVGGVALGVESWRFGVLFVIGALLGVSLYHASFGFTAAYRNAISKGDISGIIAQLLMIGFAMLLFAPFLAPGSTFGQSFGGTVAPVSLRVAVGSFLFGLGMQLGGGCGSGTLFTVGGGSTRMVVTLLAFCTGSFIGSLDIDRWLEGPSLGGISLVREFGALQAVLIQAGILALVWWGFRRWAGDRPQRPIWGDGLTWRQLVRGPWPLLFGGALLALLNWATLMIAGHPWSVTSAFALWGAKAWAMTGWDPASSTYWAGAFRQAAIERSVFQHQISIMNIGIILGALTSAGLAGRYAPMLKIPFRSLAAAVIGGLLMGYGARLAFGCNIGAFFSGTASFSLHAWLWIVFAFAGTWIGVKLRPWFGFSN
ncbi:MAG: YeeE/YedE family protein [Pseudomonadota bacterium]